MIRERLFFFTTLFLALSASAQDAPLRLWYDRPALQWEETLPLGNGRLGMTPDGGITRERIVLNDITLWSGAPQDANNYTAHLQLPRIQQLLREGRNDEAQRIIDTAFICKGPGSGGPNYGCFQLLGNLDITYTHNDSGYDQYQRQLSLDNAIARCRYRTGGVTFTREYFTSFGDDVAIIRLTADKPHQLNLRLTLDRPERAKTSTSHNTLQMQGRLDNGIDGKGMQYLACIRARVKDGEQSTNDTALIITNATEAILIISAGTDWHSPKYQERVRTLLATAEKRSYAAQKQQHITHYRKLFSRVSFVLGQATPAHTSAEHKHGPSSPDNISVLHTSPSSPPSSSQFSSPADLPTDRRLSSFHANPASDNAFPALFYQYGRYLSISSTRVGLLPPNLQGLWANQLHTPWNGDYHLDINVQMNHWPLELSNLSELNLPLKDLIKGMLPNGGRTAKAYYNAKGWVAHVITNLWGFTEPGEAANWGITKCGSGWLCNNLWEHYAFTGDTKYLKDIYPILKGAAQFYNSILITEPNHGWLVTAPSSSPENGFLLPNGNTAAICMGPTIDNQIIRELFTNTITAARSLRQDLVFSDTLAARIRKLPPAGVVAPDGRLMEWLEDYKETEPHHRCISHLYGLFPANLITPENTPGLAAACKKSLEARGDDGPAFAIAHKILWWARLHDGNRAYSLFTKMTNPTLATFINYGDGGGIYPNLLSAGPPFQIDGNFGATAGIAEMLLQSHEDCIWLLPALPDAWKSYGKIKGLKARGNFTVDMEWKNGRITHYRIASTTARKVKVRFNGEQKEILCSAI